MTDTTDTEIVNELRDDFIAPVLGTRDGVPSDRVDRAIAYVCGRTHLDAIELRLIGVVTVDDHKGILTVTTRTPLRPYFCTAFCAAWQNESEALVEFVHAGTGQRYWDDRAEGGFE